MSTLDPIKAHRFRCDISIAQTTVLQGISPGRASSAATAWAKWIEFTTDVGLDPFLQAFADKVPILQVFVHRVHIGELAANSGPVRARTAEDYVRHVAQAFLQVGADDPRHNSAHKIDFRLQRTLKAWKSTDPAPDRIKPVPITVIRRIATLAQTTQASDAVFCATADMIIIAFFFLLRPGEYTDNPNNPFRFADVQLFIGDTRINLNTAPIEQIQQARFASLTFTNQKNGVRGEVIGLARSGDPYLCPVLSIIRRVLYLRQHSAPSDTPLARVVGAPSTVSAAATTTCLRDSVAYLGPQLGFLPSDISARCLRAAGPTALLLANVDPDVIRLIGRWRSDEMLRYLHVQAYPLMKHYAQKMLTAGMYTLIPNHLVPQR